MIAVKTENFHFEMPELVATPMPYGPTGCSVCDWGKADVVVLGRTVCVSCAVTVAAEIDRLQRQEGAK